MNIEFLSKALFGNATMLATVMIAFAGAPALLIPVRATIFNLASIPSRVILANSIFAGPLAHAIVIAKEKLVIFKFSRGNMFGRTTPSAKYSKVIPSWMIFAYNILTSPFAGTCCTTEVVFTSFKVAGLNVKRFITPIAAVSSTIPVRAILSRHIFTIPLPKTIFITEMMLIPLGTGRQYVLRLAAPIAEYLYFPFILWIIFTLNVLASPFAVAHFITKVVLLAVRRIDLFGVITPIAMYCYFRGHKNLPTQVDQQIRRRAGAVSVAALFRMVSYAIPSRYQL